MRLICLGDLAVEGAAFRRAGPLLLLTYLSLEGRQPRAHLAELFWQRGEARTRRQRLNNLSQALSLLRRHIPGVVGGDDTHAWSLVTTDVAAFQHALRGRAYARALTLYTGPFLSGHDLGWGTELEGWVFDQRETLAEQAQGALIALAERDARRRPHVAAQRARDALALAEPPPDVLPRLYALLRAYDVQLAREVEDRARGHGVLLEAPALPSPVPETAPEAPLPAPGTSFVGRRQELAALTQRLQHPECRLLTLTGAGGTGKSRLAVQVAQEVRGQAPFRDGVVYVPLESLGSAPLLASRIATQLGVTYGGPLTALDAVRRHLGGQAVLLVLDNFEHLTEGAALLGELLHGCAQLTLLTTSRVPLGLVEEWIFPLQGLALPADTAPPEVAAQADAVRLFCQRARQAGRTFGPTADELPLIAEICRRLDGVPLAIELAAAWTTVVSLQDLVREVSSNLDALRSPAFQPGGRHRDLRAVFDGSWALLSTEEQRVLAALSVFRGGFTREAAAEVAGASLTILAALVGKALLRARSPGRYDQHPLVAQYAREQLARDPGGLGQLQARHLKVFLLLAQRIRPLLDGAGQREWLERLEDEHDNFRAALAYALARPESGQGLALAGMLWWFWHTRGHHTEGRAWLETALEQAHPAPSPERALALRGAGWLAMQQSDYPVANTHLRACLAAYRQLDRPHDIAVALNNLAGVAYYAGHLDQYEQYLTEALTLCRALGDARRTAVVLGNLGNLAFERGDPEQARALYWENLRLLQELGDEKLAAESLIELGGIETALGNHLAARDLIDRGLVVARALAHPFNTAFGLEALGTLDRREGHHDRARHHYQQSLVLWHQLGHRLGVVHVLEGLLALAVARSAWRQAAQILGAVQALRDTIGVPSSPYDQREFGPVLEALAPHLDHELCASAHREGQAMPLGAMVAALT